MFGRMGIMNTNLGGMQGSTLQIPVTPISNRMDASKLFGFGPDGNGVSVGSLTTSALTIGEGKPKDLIINGIHLGINAQEAADLTVEGTYNAIINMWDYNKNSVFGKTSRLLRTYTDVLGTKYALIKTTYNWNLNYASNVLSCDNADNDMLTMMNTAVSQNLYFKDLYEVVVIGFTFTPENVRLMIPNFVKIPSILDSILPENNIYDSFYPVREIWGCHIYAKTVKNSTTHLLSPDEFSTPAEILDVPTALYAPFIRKITLKRRIDNNLWFFSGVSPQIISLPAVEKIVGLSEVYKAPILCGLNMNGRALRFLHLPALKEIKNCVFACGNASLNDVSLPVLEKIVETTFIAMCPELVEVCLPYLRVVRGCDFFLAQDINLESLRLNCNVAFQPHEILPTYDGRNGYNQISATNTFLEILTAVMAVIGLTPQFSTYRRYGGNNSMSFFLKDDRKLANFATKVDPESTDADTKVIIDTNSSNWNGGIQFDYSTIGSLPVYAIYEPRPIGRNVENYQQYINRVNYEHAQDNHWVPLTPDTTSAPTTITVYGKACYAIDPVTGVLLYNGSEYTGDDAKLAATDMVVPIDPRTALIGGTEKTAKAEAGENTFGIMLTEAAYYIAEPDFGNMCDEFFRICLGWRNYMSEWKNVFGEISAIPKPPKRT